MGLAPTCEFSIFSPIVLIKHRCTLYSCVHKDLHIHIHLAITHSQQFNIMNEQLYYSLDQPDGDSQICSPNIPSYLLTGDKNPTLDECKNIIVELQAKTQQQSHEVLSDYCIDTAL